jgi:hypothetical protein
MKMDIKKSGYINKEDLVLIIERIIEKKMKESVFDYLIVEENMVDYK